MKLKKPLMINNMSKQLSLEGIDATLPDSFESDSDWRCAVIAKLWTDDGKKVIEEIENVRKRNEEILGYQQ